MKFKYFPITISSDEVVLVTGHRLFIYSFIFATKPTIQLTILLIDSFHGVLAHWVGGSAFWGWVNVAGITRVPRPCFSHGDRLVQVCSWGEWQGYEREQTDTGPYEARPHLLMAGASEPYVKGCGYRKGNNRGHFCSYYSSICLCNSVWLMRIGVSFFVWEITHLLNLVGTNTSSSNRS